ncbi:hypothetical protein MBANPS3_005368, partial [Mucor bainieri]
IPKSTSSDERSDDENDIFQKPLPKPKPRPLLSSTKKPATAASKPLPRLKLERDASVVRSKKSASKYPKEYSLDQYLVGNGGRSHGTIQSIRFDVQTGASNQKPSKQHWKKVTIKTSTKAPKSGTIGFLSLQCLL